MIEILMFFSIPLITSFVLFYFSNKGEEARENIERKRANLMERKLRDCEEEVEFYKHRLKLAKSELGEQMKINSSLTAMVSNGVNIDNDFIRKYTTIKASDSAYHDTCHTCSEKTNEVLASPYDELKLLCEDCYKEELQQPEVVRW